LQVAGILATLGIFIVIAAVQSRWIAQLSEAELHRAKSRLQDSMGTVRTDVNRELMKAFSLFQFEPGSSPPAWGQMTAEAYTIWREKAKFPGVVQRVLLVRPTGGGGALEMAAYNPKTLRYDPVDWPAELNGLRTQLALPFRGFRAFGLRSFTGVALADGPVVLSPLTPSPTSRFTEAIGWVVVELDQQLLLTVMLPQIIRDDVHEPEQFDYQITRTRDPKQIVYRSNPNVTFSSTDASSSVLELGPEYFTHGIYGSLPRQQRWFSAGTTATGEDGVWRLQVRHRSGSLEAAATGLRRGNLLLGFAMLALVGADLAVLLLLARRAHRMGEARMEFAAVVSHELRTPLAAICSAADNLAAGVAHEPSRVQQYGAAILSQGKQLGELVEQILAFASGQFRKQNYELEPLDLGGIVTQALAAVAPAASAAGVTIEQHIPAGLPQILGDAGAIQQALVNLLNNAIKYGASGLWIGVSLSSSKASELEVGVEDKGPGIRAGDLKRIFEPFQRGSAAATAQSHGAGLGLTIVEQIARAHGGRVTVVSAPGRGSCFSLHLPTI
jgi:signal transduction histidine kinase